MQVSYISSYPTPTLGDPRNGISPRKLNFGKHTSMAYCPDNGKIYLVGGDGTGRHINASSGAMDTVATYDVTTHSYAEDFDYQGAQGEATPRGLDFIPFIWSPQRKEFWLGPGYAWNYGTDKYPWRDLSWTSARYASYNPITKKFTDRGAKGGSSTTLPGEAFAGSWDTRRNQIVVPHNQGISFINPTTLAITRRSLDVSSYPIATSPTWYDADTDEIFFVQVSQGRVYGHNIGTSATRLIAQLLATPIDTGTTRAVVFIPDQKYVLVVYDVAEAGPTPWKLVNLTTGQVTSFNGYARGFTRFDTGAYSVAAKTIVLTGGGTDGNNSNGAFFHEYRVESDSALPPDTGEPGMPTPQELVASGEAHLNLLYAHAGQPSLVEQLAAKDAQIVTLTTERDAANAKVSTALSNLNAIKTADAAADAAETAAINDAIAALQ